jgi:hypothetical protein
MRTTLVLALVFMTLFRSTAACTLNDTRIQNDLFINVRDLFDLGDSRPIALVDSIEKEEIKPQVPVAFLELLSEDKFYDQQQKKKDQPCPDRVIRNYLYFGQDEFAKCNALLSVDIIQGLYKVLYKNCVRP